MVALQDIRQQDLESVVCALCGSASDTILFTISGFPIRRCPKCSMRFVSPRLRSTDLLDMYSDESYFHSDNSLVHGYVDYAADRPNIIRTFKQRLDWILRQTGLAQPGRMLDVGCAFGFAVEYAVSRGWDAYGIEPSTHAATSARKALGDRVIQGTLDRHSFSAGHFDTILLWDVIEHVPDPVKTLEQAYALLKHGGILSLITPDCGSLLARLMGQHWMEYAKPTEHIHFFTRQTMTQALTKAGFQNGAQTTAGKHIGLNFIVDRLTAHFPIFSKWKTSLDKPSASKALIYVNPFDKMHLLAVKPLLK